MTEPVITHGGVDRRFMLCRCNGCGVVDRCTPDRDFFTRAKDGPTGPLYCWDCLISGAGIPPQPEAAGPVVPAGRPS